VLGRRPEPGQQWPPQPRTVAKSVLSLVRRGMALLDMHVFRSWLLGDKARWWEIATRVVVARDGTKSRILAVTDRDVIFGRVSDFVPRTRLFAMCEALEVSPWLAARIEKDLAADAAAAAVCVRVRDGADRQATERAEREKREREEKTRRLIDADAAVLRIEAEEWVAAQMQRLAERARDRHAAVDVYRSGLSELRERVSARGVTALRHFTRAANLAAILREGIRPRAELPRHSVAANDRLRTDDAMDAVCLSVSFPNYRVFHAFRERDPGELWVVLGITASVLSAHPCAFNPTNAGSRACSRVSWTDRATPAAFDRMFAEVADWAPARIERASLRLPSHFTTDPQAEVLLFGTVPPESIFSVAFETSADRRAWETSEPALASSWGKQVTVDTALFRPRADHRAWSQACRTGSAPR